MPVDADPREGARRVRVSREALLPILEGVQQRLSRTLAMLKGDVQPELGPAGMALETTVRCDLRCPMCPRTAGHYPEEDMPDTLLFPLLEAFAQLGGDYLYLNGLGEPFLDPRLFEILRRCRRLGLQTLVSTHGGHLDEPRRRALLDDPCDVLTVSIDAFSEETYRKVRVGGELSRVRANVLALVQEKRRRQVPLHVSIQLVLMDRNRHEVPDFLHFWQHMEGVDSVRLNDEEFGLPHIADYQPRARADMPACRLPWRGPLLARYNGDLYACFPMTYDARPLGNLHREGLEQLWNGEAMRTLRRLHAAGEGGRDASCVRCPVVQPHLPFTAGAMLVRGATAQKLIPWAEQLAFRGLLPFAQTRARRR